MATNESDQPTESAKEKLNPKQRKFCELYASSEEFFGNGVRSYIEAYDVDVTQRGVYASARARASQLLTNVNVLAYINEILEAGNLNDSFVDKQLSFLVTQNAELGVKMQAIREYNTLNKRTAKQIELLGLNETRKKIASFLDDPTDYDNDRSGESTQSEPNAPGAESAAADSGPGGGEVAPTPPTVP